MEKNITKFPDKVTKGLGYYIYALIDPRKDSYGIFYIGKGKGNRVFNHVKDALKYNPQEKSTKKAEQKEEIATNEKYETIKAIENAGEHVKYYILRHGITCEEMAYQIESTLIDTFNHLQLFAKIDTDENKNILRNIICGHDQGLHGIKTIEETIDFYNSGEVDLLPYMRRKMNFIAIKLSENFDSQSKDEDIYERVHFCWRVNKDRIKKIQYVLAISNGIIRGIYPCHNQAWKKVQDKERKVDEDHGRYYFEKQEPTNPTEFEKLKKELVGNKLIGLHHAQNPVAYFDHFKLKEIDKEN